MKIKHFYLLEKGKRKKRQGKRRKGNEKKGGKKTKGKKKEGKKNRYPYWPLRATGHLGYWPLTEVPRTYENAHPPRPPLGP